MQASLMSPWQKRRSTFNHDWLKNQFIPALAKLLNLLDSRIEDVEFEKSFVPFVLPQWESYREEALLLPRDFEQQMSPGNLFDLLPLSQCDKHTKQWLRKLVHIRWFARYPVKRWIADASAAAKAADDAYDQLQEALQGSIDIRSAAALQPFRKQFLELRQRCQELASAIREFPSEVRVT